MNVQTIVLALAVTASAPVIPQDVCKNALLLLHDSDAVCVESASGYVNGRLDREYACIDKNHEVFFVIRTPSDKS